MTPAAEEAVRDAVTDSVTFAFGDPSAEVYGLARLGLSRAGEGGRSGSALVLLFSGREPVAALARGALPVAADAGWEALQLAGWARRSRRRSSAGRWASKPRTGRASRSSSWRSARPRP